MPKLLTFLLGSDPKLRRMLLYWAATGALYLVGIGLLQLQIYLGTAVPAWTALVSWFCVAGVALFFGLVRVSLRLGLTPTHLAVMQAVFAIACVVGSYAVMGLVRGAALMVLLVIIVFCAFTLRPRAVLWLCAFALGLLGLTMLGLMRFNPVLYPPQVEGMHFVLATCMLVAVSLLTGEMSKLRSRLKQQKTDLEAAVGTIRTLATVDELTSLSNRRHMNEVLHEQERRHTEPERPMCIALLDLDFFKRVNDNYGHDGGDAVLRSFASAARTELRADDVLARWGGEEFLLLLPQTGMKEAQMVLKRMAEKVGAVRIPELDVELRITFSGGLAERVGWEPFAETITRADKAMYIAKSSGRNRVVAA